MINNIYIENNILNHKRVKNILKILPKANVIPIERYTEIFNKNTQNFRLQKLNPALILAKKHDNFIHNTPVGYGLGDKNNYYFAHMLNCIFDCKYCFLQGMYRSANYVIFINFEDFFKSIENIILNNNNFKATFFSGYDCDSLANDNLTGFASTALNFFKNYPNINIEFRTKSTYIQPFYNKNPINNCIVAYSFTPNIISETLEYGVPNLTKRIKTIEKLAKSGWKIGLRFDPLIYFKGWKENYNMLFKKIFSSIPIESVHSVSYGTLRFPNHIFKKIEKLYPEEKVFFYNKNFGDGMATYPKDLENEIKEFCINKLSNFIDKNKIFSCDIS